MTYRELINSVLRRLREDTIDTDWSGAINDSSVLTDYQKLIGEFVNETKREVEDSWNWTALRNIVTIPTVDGTSVYTITGVNDRHRLIDIYSQVTGTYLSQLSSVYIKRRKFPTDQKGTPSYYSTTATTIELHPTPNKVENMDLIVTDVQDELTTASEALKVNGQAVVLGAFAKAISERGEDGGTTIDAANFSYEAMVSDLVAQDVARVSDELEWFSA